MSDEPGKADGAPPTEPQSAAERSFLQQSYVDAKVEAHAARTSAEYKLLRAELNQMVTFPQFVGGIGTIAIIVIAAAAFFGQAFTAGLTTAPVIAAAERNSAAIADLTAGQDAQSDVQTNILRRLEDIAENQRLISETITRLTVQNSRPDNPSSPTED